MVAELGLGCFSFGGIGGNPADDANSSGILAAARAKGILHWDTAQDYGAGHSETVIGAFLEANPGPAFVATKTAFRETAAEVIARVEESRERLRVPAIDLFYIHWPRHDRDPAPMVEALETCRSRGWIRRIGVSNFSADQMRMASKAGRIDYHQMGYNLFWRFPEEEILPYCREYGIKAVVYSPLAQGLLTDRGHDRTRWAADDPRFRTVFYRPDVWPQVKKAHGAMREAAASVPAPLEELALRWVLTRPGIAVVLVGVSRIAQLDANVGTLERAGADGKVVLDLQAISDRLKKELPRAGNMFQYYP